MILTQQLSSVRTIDMVVGNIMDIDESMVTGVVLTTND